ncbi:MAG: hypothetical protein A2W19_00795 [Spirochaetes bacterium RBG_16_49_21]|nr:MAG: hypothetical protein A2W19_00795 [Spirochaetes bacterium RBG_16_49_21]
MNKKNKDKRFKNFLIECKEAYLNKDAIIPLLILFGTPAALFFWFFIFPSLNIGDSSLLDTSKNTECGKDIQEALRTFNQNMNMPYKIEPEDYKIIFNKGQIQKEYDRDGIHFTAYFNINKTKEGCFLKFFKRGKFQPGRLETTLGNYGNIMLKKCQCE